MKENEIEYSLVKTLKESELSSILEEYSELTIKSLFENELVDKIPVIKTIRAIYQTSKSIQNYIFTKKILKFMFNVKDISILDRQKMLDNLNEKDTKEIGETIILSLEKSDDYKKCTLIANAFQGLVEEKINYSTFKRLLWSIQSINLQVLDELLNIYDKDDSVYDRLKSGNYYLPQSEELQQLALSGLLSIHFKHSQDRYNSGALGGYSINYLGEIFCQICIKKQDSEYSYKGNYVYDDNLNRIWELEKIEIKPE